MQDIGNSSGAQQSNTATASIIPLFSRRATSTPGSTAEVKKLSPYRFETASDVEIAETIQLKLQAHYGEVVGCEGAVWAFNGKCWEAIPEHVLERLVHHFDGAAPARGALRKITHNTVMSILSILAAKLERPDFFRTAPRGICCESGFITFDNGAPRQVPHNRDQRQRFVLPGK